MLSSSTYDSLAHTHESLGGLLGEWALRRSLRGPPSESSSTSAPLPPPLPPSSSSPISSQSAASSSQGGLVDSWIAFVRNRVIVVPHETKGDETSTTSTSTAATVSLNNLLAPLLIAPPPNNHHHHSSAEDHTTDDESHHGVDMAGGGCRLAGVATVPGAHEDDDDPSASSQLATTLCVLMLSMVRGLPSPDAIGIEGVELLHSLQEELFEQLCEMVMGGSAEDGVVPLTVAWQMVVCASVVVLFVFDERGVHTPTSTPPQSSSVRGSGSGGGGVVDRVSKLLDKAISTLRNPSTSSSLSPQHPTSNIEAGKEDEMSETYTPNFLKYETIGESLLFETADQGDCFPPLHHCATTPQSQLGAFSSSSNQHQHQNPLTVLMPVLGALERAVGCLTEDQLTVGILILECLGDPPSPPPPTGKHTMMGFTSSPPGVARAHLRTLRVTKVCGGTNNNHGDTTTSSRGKDIRMAAIKDKITKWNAAAVLWGAQGGINPPSSSRISGMKRSRPCVVHSSCGSDNNTTTATVNRAVVVAEEGGGASFDDDEEASIFGKVRRKEEGLTGGVGSVHSHQASHPQSALLFSSSSSLLPPPSPIGKVSAASGLVGEVSSHSTIHPSGIPGTSHRTSSSPSAATSTQSTLDGILSAISQAHEDGEQAAQQRATTVTAPLPPHPPPYDHPPSQPSDPHCTPSSIEDCTTQSTTTTTTTNLTTTQGSTTTSSRYIDNSQDSLSQAGPPLPLSGGLGLSRGQLSIISTAADAHFDDSGPSHHPRPHITHSLPLDASNTLSAASLGNISVNTAAPPPSSRRHNHASHHGGNGAAPNIHKHVKPATTAATSHEDGHGATTTAVTSLPRIPSPQTTSQLPPLVEALSQITQMVLSPHIPSPTASHTGTVVSNAATEQLLCYLRNAGRSSAASTTTASSSQPLRVSINVGKDHTGRASGSPRGGGDMGSTPLTVTTTHTTTDSARPSGGGRWSSDDDRAVSSGLGSCRIGSTTATKSGRGSSSVYPSPPQLQPPHQQSHGATRSASAVHATQQQQPPEPLAAAAGPLPLVPANVSHLSREELEDRLRDAEGCIRLLGAQVRDNTHQQQQLTESVSHLQGWLQETWEGMRLTTIAVLEHLQQQQHHQ